MTELKAILAALEEYAGDLAIYKNSMRFFAQSDENDEWEASEETVFRAKLAAWGERCYTAANGIIATLTT